MARESFGPRAESIRKLMTSADGSEYIALKSNVQDRSEGWWVFTPSVEIQLTDYRTQGFESEPRISSSGDRWALIAVLRQTADAPADLLGKKPDRTYENKRSETSVHMMVDGHGRATCRVGVLRTQHNCAEHRLLARPGELVLLAWDSRSRRWSVECAGLHMVLAP